MKGFFQRILSRLKLDGRDWTVLLLSLLLAFGIWFIHNLSLKYDDTVTVTVRAKCSLEGHSELSSNTVTVEGRCRAIGFNLIRSEFLSRHKETVVPFETESLGRVDDDTYFVTRTKLQDKAHIIFGEGTTEHQVFTDTVYFTFNHESYKKVPVRLNGYIETASQYAKVGELKFVPDSVTLYGRTELVNGIESVSTARFQRFDLDKSISGTLKLEHIDGVRMSAETVQYEQTVSRFVELASTVRLAIENAPEDKEIVLIPASVDVTYKCVFPFDDDPSSKSEFYIDYRDYENSRSGKCIVRSRKIDDRVISYDVEPQIIDIIVSDKEE